MNQERPDFIFFALARWDGPYSSTAISLARELSRGYRVFYIDNPFTLKDIVKGWGGERIKRRRSALFFGRRQFVAIESGNPNLIGVTPTWTFSLNFLPVGKLFRLLSRVNERRVERILNDIIGAYSVKDFIFINCYNPFYFQDRKKIPARLAAYYTFDNIEKSKYIGKHGSNLELEVMAGYDITLATSRGLFQKALAVAKKAYLLPNAGDYELFNTAAGPQLRQPPEIPSDGRRIIGYIGHVDDRLDYIILSAIARTLTDCLLVLVGPVSGNNFSDHLAAMPNMISVGKRDLSELPAYVSRFDCCIIPFKCNELTAYIYPLKVNEYLAAGKPVVSTRFSEDISAFGNQVVLANGPDDFVSGIRECFSNGGGSTPESRMDTARSNSWQGRAISLLEIIREQKQI
jgi:glycosyltransferase involved in cell wall biosynthesis